MTDFKLDIDQLDQNRKYMFLTHTHTHTCH